MGRKDTKKRGGDVLGLGGADTSITNHDDGMPSETSERDTARRRKRMSSGADEVTPGGGTSVAQSSGATGIDMGGGGEGTDVE